MKSKKKQKLYCYVDETGQDTMGELFIVSVVVTGEFRDRVVMLLEKIEKISKKAKSKWIHSRPSERVAYIEKILRDLLFKHTLYYSFYKETNKYMALTVLTTARVISSVPEPNTTAVFIDGLPRPRVQWFGTELRHLCVRTSKVVGVRKEESDPLIRLADACCGFVRQALAGSNQKMLEMFERAKEEGYLKEV